tara:strand:- start:1755 stop:2024 length:270 start_codon:yes stop_codon:yes gene_type:complete
MTLELRLTTLVHAIGADIKAIYFALTGKADVNHVHSVATSATDGFMSTAQAIKLDNLNDSSTAIFVNSASKLVQTQNAMAKIIKGNTIQ